MNEQNTVIRFYWISKSLSISEIISNEKRKYNKIENCNYFSGNRQNLINKNHITPIQPVKSIYMVY